jgi:hypothetical protein
MKRGALRFRRALTSAPEGPPDRVVIREIDDLRVLDVIVIVVGTPPAVIPSTADFSEA